LRAAFFARHVVPNFKNSVSYTIFRLYFKPMKNIVMLLISIPFFSQQVYSQNISLKELLALKDQEFAEVETYITEKGYEFQESGVNAADVFDTAYTFSYGRSTTDFKRAEKFFVYHRRYNTEIMKTEAFTAYQFLSKDEYVKIKKEIIQGFKLISSTRVDDRTIGFSYTNEKIIIYLYTVTDTGNTHYMLKIMDDLPYRRL